ncbi:unnamed protein product [Ascophyllum nodosum]
MALLRDIPFSSSAQTTPCRWPQRTFRVSTPSTDSASPGTRTATSTLCKTCSGLTGRA